MEPILPALTLAFSLVGTSRRADRQSDYWSRFKGLAAVSVALATSVRVLLAVVVFLAPIVCGAATSWAETSSRSWIVTLDRSFGPGWLQAIIALPTGGYALAGRRGPQPKWDAKAIPKASVIRLDERGEVAWETTVDGRRLDLFGGLSLTPGGQLVLTGFGDNGTDWALAIGPSGKVVSEKSLGWYQSIFRRTVMLANGDWVSLGDDFGTGPPMFTLFRFDPNGVFVAKQALLKPAHHDAPTPLVAPVGSSA